MSHELKSYIIACTAMFTCALGIVLWVWKATPVVGNPWSEVVWFVIAATLAESMAVYIDQEKGYAVSPCGPIHWAAVCVLGPFPALVGAVITGVIVTFSKYASFKIIDKIDEKNSIDYMCQDRWPRCLIKLVQPFISHVRYVALLWPNPKTYLAAAFMLIQFASSLIMNVGPAGLAYHYTGGQSLAVAGPHFSMLNNFLLPFVALLVVSITADSIAIIPIMVVVNIPSGRASLREIVLTAKLTAVEMCIPLAKPQLLLGIVALSLAYLYAHLHLLGFIVAAAPIIALRDFFNQWVAEREAYVGTITTLATYMQHYHPYTRGHLKRVADLSERLARELRLPLESIRFIGTAGMLHDIGKIGVSEEILDKTEKLTDEEWVQIKEHPVKGAEIISHLEFLDGIVDWIKYHHKWYNGSGYPATNGNGAALPMEALIIATVDAFDAMTDDRELTLDWKCDSCGHVPESGERPDRCPSCGAQKRRTYRQPKTLDGAIDELRRGAGSQFHPMVVKAFLTMVERDGVRTNV